MREIFFLIIFILIVFAIFYGIWKLSIKTSTKLAKRSDEQKLLKLYKQGRYNQRLVLAIVFGLLFSPLGGIYMYYLYKKQHVVFENELESRNIQFEHIS